MKGPKGLKGPKGRMTQAATITGRFLTAEEVGRVLGVSLRTVAEWQATGLLGYFKAGRVVRFEAAEVMRFIEAQSRKGQMADGTWQMSLAETDWGRIERLIREVLTTKNAENSENREELPNEN